MIKTYQHAEDDLLKELKHLRADNDLLKRSQTYTQVGSWQLDCLNNKIHLSVQACDIFGIDVECRELFVDELLNKIYPDDREIVKQLYKKSISSHQPHEIIYRILMSDNSIKYVRECCEIVCEEDGNISRLFGVVQDVSFFKETDSLLQQSTKYLRRNLDKRTTNLVELSRLIQDGIQQRLQIEKKLTLHQNILIAIAEIAQNFQVASGWTELVDLAIEQLGRAACVSRVYLFRNHKADNGSLLCSQLYEICAEGISHQIDNIKCQNIDWYAAGLGDWYETMLSGNVVLRKHSQYTQAEREILSPQQILSVLVVPLFIKGSFWGFMGFDDCEYEKQWTDAEIAALKSAAIVIAGAIEREQSEQVLRENEEIRLHHAEKQRDELVREVHHRIKNHLHGLMGLLRERKKQGFDNYAIIDEAISQIESIAIVYGLQSTHSSAQIYFSQMMNAIIHSASSLSAIPISTVQDAEEDGSCEVDRSKAVALALVINEIMMNAIKHFQSIDKNADIQICHEHKTDYILLSISNPGHLPEGFDLQSEKYLGTGLYLAKSMLPSKGAKFYLEQINNRVVATLHISSPLLIDY